MIDSESPASALLVAHTVGTGPSPARLADTRRFRLSRPVIGVTSWALVLVPSVSAVLSPATFAVSLTLIAGYCATRMTAMAVFGSLGVRRIARALNRPIGTVPISEEGYLHVLLLPTFGESQALLAGSIERLRRHAQARTHYIVVLAAEAAEPGGARKVRALKRQFHDAFRLVLHTVHPRDSAEFPGKSANLRHASLAIEQTLFERYRFDRRRLLVTVLDSDTVAPEAYFLELVRRHEHNPHRQETLYAPPIVFGVNSAATAGIVRFVDACWAIAVLQNLSARRRLRFPASVYSLSYELVCATGHWDAGPEAVSEDFHAALKCYFETSGRLRVETVYIPVGCRHAAGTGLWDQLRERYRQAVRHAFAAMDVPYAFVRAAEAGEINLMPRVGVVARVMDAHLLPIAMGYWAVIVPVLALWAPPSQTAAEVVRAAQLVTAVGFAVQLAAMVILRRLLARRMNLPDQAKYLLDVFWAIPAIAVYGLACGLLTHARVAATGRLVPTVSRK